MNLTRRSFFKVIGGLSASIALPVDTIAAILPKTWGISPVRWTKAYDLYIDAWIFRADCFVGREVDSTPTEITIENPIQLHVDLRSVTEELSAENKEMALDVLMTSAKHELGMRA